MRPMPIASILLVCLCVQAEACQLVPPIRETTLAERLGGVKEIFGGTVIGYVGADGTHILGSAPSQCLDENGDFRWWADTRLPECDAYQDVSAALFRVDVPIVGPAAGEIATYFMTWGDGDCNTDFNVGEKWLIAGGVIEELHAPIREDEIVTLRRLAALPAFDFRTLYPPEVFSPPPHPTSE